MANVTGLSAGIDSETAAEHTPAISVIIAAHNRSNVLRLAMTSVLAQGFRDFELWVGCDDCSDDSAQVARSFADARVHVVAFPRRLGDQFQVSNELLARCRGRLIAYLNQDDLWFPEHLELARTELSEHDIYLGLVATITGDGPELGPMRFHPKNHHPMSSRVLRRELLERVGPYRHPLSLIAGSADEWLFRAWRQGARLALGRTLSVVKINSVLRPLSYQQRPDNEQQELVRSGLDQGLRERLLDAARTTAEARSARPSPWRQRSWRERLRSLAFVARQALIRLLQMIGTPLGVPPQSIARWCYGQRRGDFQRALNRERGS
jgi:glycosyltransferase involved in cell wall biosynthesis